MTRLAARAAVAAAVGAVVAAVAGLVVMVRNPAATFEMDREMPAMASGFYPSERAGTETFIWTSPRAQLVLAGADRGVTWSCRIRFRGGRPPEIVQPRVDLLVDGVTVASVPSVNEYQEVEVLAPVRPRGRGLTLSVYSSEVFRPGGGDPRELGVLVDRMACTPAGGAVAWPAPGVIGRVALAGAAFGLGLVLAGFTLTGALLGGLALAPVLAAPFTVGPAAYTSFPGRLVWLVVGVSVVLVAVSRVVMRVRQASLDASLAAVIGVSGLAVILKLAGLLHPFKGVVDALYHAHRLDWVLEGRYYFTQVMPDGVQFPYAIALYVFAAPFAVLTTDHVLLLRVVVVGVEAVAAGLLYWMVARIWRDRLAAVLAVVAFHALPGTYPVLGNANFTNTFGQSAALIAMAAAVLLSFTRGRLPRAAFLTVLVSVALLSHVSTAALTVAAFLSFAVALGFLGRGEQRAAALTVFWSVVAAAVLSVGVYWGHFIDTYRTLARVRADQTVEAVTDPGVQNAASGRSIPARVAAAMRMSQSDMGWPLLLLAVAGAVRLWRDRRCDRLGFALAGWAAAYLAFVCVAVLAPVTEGYERYSAEFVSRVDLAVYPAVALLAAAGGAALWRAGVLPRLAGVGLGLLALAGVARQWHLWFQ